MKMDSIYSRKRIKIPKVEIFYKNNKNAKRFFSIFIIIFIAIFTFYSIFKSLNPIFEELCKEKAKEIGTNIINNASNTILDNIDYRNIVSIEENNNNKVLKTDVVVINKIASNIALEAEKEFKELGNQQIKIPVGSLTGNKYFAGIGPKINIQVIPTGNILTEIKSEFKEKGINQTVYRIYLELKCNVNIVSNYKTIEDEIINQVLLVETVIVGNVPNSYYNLEGINQENAIDIIE